MSRKRTKQYLMLLMVIGLVSVSAGGSGTFASFSAETTNAGNYFATGSLILNDKGGTNTCTSAGDLTNNANTANTNGCDTFFALNKLTTPSATTTTSAVTGGSTSIAFTGGLVGAAIDAGDTLTITDGTNTDTVTASTGADVGATSVGITAGPGHTYAIGSTVTDAAATYYAKLTLTNAGTINASGIKFKIPSCTNSAQEGTATLNGGLSLNATITSLTVNAVSGTFATGDPVVVTDGGTHSQTFIASAPVADGDTTISIQSAKVNFAYADTAAVSGPTFTSPGNVCTALKFSIVETDSAFDHDGSNNASGCAYGTVDPNNSTDGLGCTYGSGHLLTDPSALTSLSLATAGGSGNSGKLLSASGSRYFLIAVKFPGTSLTNAYQNRKSAFDVTWHIDQA
jgi:hypothetical protein